MKQRKDLYKYDAATRQANVLDYVLKTERGAQQPQEPQVSVEAARHGLSLYEVTSNREETRLLFISQDTSLLNQTQQTLDGYLDLSDVFDEVHIVILRQGIKAKDPILRVAPNVWLYIATAQHWWLVPFVALRMIRQQMVFADGFRPDLIVARDAYESALVARVIAKEFDRPSQLHILENFTSRQFLLRTPHARWRRLLARYFTRRFQSIRTATHQIQTLIEHYYPNIPDVATLPRFNNYQERADPELVKQLRARYPQFTFLYVYVGPLGHTSTAYKAIDATRFALRNSRVGLIVIGDGKARSEFQKRTQILGIDTQVIFERAVENVETYLAAADVVIVTDTDAVGDEVAIRSAAAGRPLVMTKTPVRDDLFIDEESALLCNSSDVTELTKAVSRLLNDHGLRSHLMRTSEQLIASRLHEDPTVYRHAYRTSVEDALFVGETDAATDEATTAHAISSATKKV